MCCRETIIDSYEIEELGDAIYELLCDEEQHPENYEEK